jgi:alcohol dehydrogenase class IV
MWVSPSVADWVCRRLPYDRVSDVAALRGAGDAIVIGGGSMLDAAKLDRWRSGATYRLIAAPSIWGSGAEATHIAVETVDGQKVAHVHPRLRPEIRVHWPELGASLPALAARHACGDAWSHVLEGSLSPLSTDAHVRAGSDLMAQMLGLPLAFHRDWFDLSARASRLQSQTSVGLAHGIAHTLESQVKLGHAQLCATLLAPVFAFTRGVEKTDRRLATSGLAVSAVAARVRELFDAPTYDRLRPLIAERWIEILRHPCTRTNARLVRVEHARFFVEYS